MKHRIIFFLKLYSISLLLFFLAIFIITFYIKNVGDREKVITHFPKIALKNQFGQLKTIDDYKGKLILVDFWFSGCKPCLEEMKFFPQLLKKHDDLVILSMSVDSPMWTQSLLTEKRKPWDFLEAKNNNWTFYNINNENLKFFKVSSFPTYFIIDKKGALLGSPKSGLYAVENKLGNIFTANLSVEKHFSAYSKKEILKVFRLYTVLFFFFTLIYVIVKYFKRYKSKTMH
ncbi:TlpA family protein disulfide reductase [Flavobacterium acetivorans]|uniref:TlpA family protein disulfide reductase n=1 Tax=Flavobacterium acetivorans TaxID=2893883 RepID=UPI001E3DB1CD|nr:TlpA disulfide reductase family protein [Flavobacterium sp. F-29]UFH34930.1 TlpA family protein disulfide reductase [Flavobacterium sp. F-29]